MLLPLTAGFTRVIPSIALISSYITSFYLLSIVSQQLPLAVIYASWAGLGVFSVSSLSFLIYKQPLSWQSIVGLVFIVLGVIIVNTYKTPLN